MSVPRPIATAEFQILNKTKMTLTVFEPAQDEQHVWGCRYRFDAPFNLDHTIFGENSLQALVLALKIAASDLYGSDLYRDGKIGVFGEIGGQLILPAPKAFIDIAPFPF
jgi:hypothetical protein